MPSRERMERATAEIKELSEEFAFERIDEERVALAPYGRGADDGFFYWGELTQAHMRDALADGVDWEGFTEAQEQDVIGRVIDGQGAEFWMDGIEPDDPRDKRPAAPDRLTRPGPKETPLERVERQIGHIKLVPDPYDYSIEDLGPWDTGVSEDWQRLPEAEKLSRLVNQVDWRDISPEDKHRLLGGEVDLARLPVETRREFEEGWAEARPRSEGGQYAVRDTTRNLLEAIALDVWPRAGAVVDFGLDSQEHYEALYHGVRNDEITPAALDAALGRGDRLTALARAAASNPHRDFEFHTSWDALRGREEPAGPEASENPPESGRGEAQPHRRLPTPSEIAGRTAAPPEKTESGPEPDRGHDR